jgi:hypothetical protein
MSFKDWSPSFNPDSEVADRKLSESAASGAAEFLP